MLVCSHCGHVVDTPSFPDQLGTALQQLSNHGSSPHAPTDGSPDHKEVFHALVYLGRSRDYNDLLAFYLLHQVYVALSRHDPVDTWPSLDEMWSKAQRKVLAAS